MLTTAEIQKIRAGRVSDLSLADKDALCDQLLAAERERPKVKPLEWQEQDRSWNAETPFGLYDIARYGKYWAVYLHNNLVAEPEDADAAKAAAQADYEARILAALAPNHTEKVE